MEYYIYVLVEILPPIYGPSRVVKAFWNEELAQLEADKLNALDLIGEFVVQQTTILRSPEE